LEAATSGNMFHMKQKELMMSTKLTAIFSVLIILVLFAVGTFFYNEMPEQMASHWNANDEVDGI